jgi:hypothetical protein
MERACALARSFAIDQVSRLLALPMDYRRIALSKEGVFDQTSSAPLVEEKRDGGRP